MAKTVMGTKKKPVGLSYAHVHQLSINGSVRGGEYP